MTGTDLETSFLAEHQLKFGTFRFYRNLVIGRINEGEQVSLDSTLPLIAIGIELYSEKRPAVYLSDRIYSYSMDPTLHLEAHKLFPFLLGYGVIAYNELNYRVARLEQRFIPCPCGIFRSMDEALSWSWQLISELGNNEKPHR